MKVIGLIIVIIAVLDFILNMSVQKRLNRLEDMGVTQSQILHVLAKDFLEKNKEKGE